MKFSSLVLGAWVLVLAAFWILAGGSTWAAEPSQELDIRQLQWQMPVTLDDTVAEPSIQKVDTTKDLITPSSVTVAQK